MKQATLAYFSGTGNTRYVAHRLAHILAQRGYRSRVFSIDGMDPLEARQALDAADLPVFAYPVYGSDIPAPMKAFLRVMGIMHAGSGHGDHSGPGAANAPSGLHDAAAKTAQPHTGAQTPRDAAAKTAQPYAGAQTQRDAAVLCTQWMFSGDGAALADAFLQGTGFRGRWTAHILMPNNVSLRAIPLPYTNDPERLGRLTARADRQLEVFATSIIEGLEHSQGRGPLSERLGRMQRDPFRKLASRASKIVGVDDDLCTRCGLCVRLCPVANLSLEPVPTPESVAEAMVPGNGTEGGADSGASAAHEAGEGVGAPALPGGQARRGQLYLVTHDRCINCLRCYSYCPTQAITFLGKLHAGQPGTTREKPYRGPEPGFNPEILRSEDVTVEPAVQ